MLFGGCHLLPFLFRVFPPLPLPLPQVVHGVRAFLTGGCPPPPMSPGCSLGEPAAWSGFPPPSPSYVREARCCLGGVPPLPPLVDALVKHVLMFGVSSLLFLVLWLATQF